MTTDNDLDKILLNYLNEIIKPDYINKVDAPQCFYDAKAAIQAHYQAREAKAVEAAKRSCNCIMCEFHVTAHELKKGSEL